MKKIESIKKLKAIGKRITRKRYLVVLLPIILVLSAFSSITFGQSDNDKPEPDWGIYEELELLQERRNSKINSIEILNETEGRLEKVDIYEEERINLTETREIRSPSIPVPPSLGIYEEMIYWDQFNNSDIISWLLAQPTNYFLFSNYTDDNDYNSTWTKCFLRPTLWDFDRWYQIDVDENSNTGDGSGYDIEVAVLPTYEIKDIEIIQDGLLQFHLKITVDGGVRLHMYKLQPSAGHEDAFNQSYFELLEIVFTKSISYEGYNFIVFGGFNFTYVVDDFWAEVTAENVILDNISFVGTLQQIQQIVQQIRNGEPVEGLLGGNIIGLTGPYHVHWNTNDSYMTDLGVLIATARVKWIDQEDYEYELVNRSWVDLYFTGEEPGDPVVREGELIADADTLYTSFNWVEWEAHDGRTCDVRIRFIDVAENVTYAELTIEDFPDSVKIDLDQIVIDDENYSTITYHASDIISYLDYKEYEYFDVDFEDITKEKLMAGDIYFRHVFVNISGIPTHFYLEGNFEMEEAKEPVFDPGLGVVGGLVDTIAQQMINRYQRIANTLRSVPDKILSMAGEQSHGILNTYGHPISSVEILLTSGDYVWTPHNFFAFYNTGLESEYNTVQRSISGKLPNIEYYNADFREQSQMTVRLVGGPDVRAIFIDKYEDLEAHAFIGGVPGEITLSISPERLEYSSSGNPSSLGQISYYSEYKGTYTMLKIEDLPRKVTVQRYSDATWISTNQGSIGIAEFAVTTGSTFYRINGSYMILRQDNDFITLSGRLHHLKSAYYGSGDPGFLGLNFEEEQALNISLLDTKDGYFSADIIFDPLPKTIAMNLSELLTDLPDIDLPEFNTGGVLGFAEIVFSIAILSNDILDIIDTTIEDALSKIDDFTTNPQFLYETDTHATIIAKIQIGDAYSLDEVDWVHGISSKQSVEEQGTNLVAKVYLTGLPTLGFIVAEVKSESILATFNITGFSPIHDWLYFDMRGLNGRDVMLYLEDIQPDLDINLGINLTAQLEKIPVELVGTIEMEATKSLGALYARINQIYDEITVGEVYLSSMPSEIELEFNVKEDTEMQLEASEDIEHMHIKIFKEVDDQLREIYCLFNDLPQEVSIKVKSCKEFDMEDTVLQTLPTIDITTDSDSLDIYLYADGRAIGQIGRTELQVVNAPSYVTGRLNGDTYEIRSDGVDYLWVHVMDLPVIEDYYLNSLELVGKDVFSCDIDVNLLFGIYPIIEVTATEGGEVQLVMDHEYDDSKLAIAFIDFKSKDGIPSTPSILINGGSLDADKGSSHLLVPAPILTVIATLFS